MAKSAVFGVMHLGIAFGVGYALTGSVTIAGAITLVEPAINTVAHYFFDRWWPRVEQRWQRRRPTPASAPISARGSTRRCVDDIWLRDAGLSMASR